MQVKMKTLYKSIFSNVWYQYSVGFMDWRMHNIYLRTLASRKNLLIDVAENVFDYFHIPNFALGAV